MCSAGCGQADKSEQLAGGPCPGGHIAWQRGTLTHAGAVRLVAAVLLLLDYGLQPGAGGTL